MATGRDGIGQQGPTDAERLGLRFVGQVQGVGFRWTSREVARTLGLTGWVRNEPDGSVSAELQGPAEAVGAWFSLMVEAYRSNPIRYVVAQRDELPPVPGETGFRVLH